MGSIGPPSPLGEALFTTTQQKVLGLLFGSPERSFYANEIVRLAEVGTGAVQRELKRLASVGLLEVSRIGNQKHYRANKESPLFHELRSIVIKTFGLADVLRACLSAAQRSIEVALIYGSVAKGTDTARSDVDLLIIGPDLSYADLTTELSNAEAQLGRKVSPTVYTPQELRRKLKRKNAFLRKVLEQPKVFLIGSERDLLEPGTSGAER
jgi:predicted nucleotidyltransferase